jgi:hypothetical protein
MLQISPISVYQRAQHPKYSKGANDALKGVLSVGFLGVMQPVFQMQLGFSAQSMILKIKSASGCMFPRNDSCITG